MVHIVEFEPLARGGRYSTISRIGARVAQKFVIWPSVFPSEDHVFPGE